MCVRPGSLSRLCLAGLSSSSAVMIWTLGVFVVMVLGGLGFWSVSRDCLTRLRA